MLKRLKIVMILNLLVQHGEKLKYLMVFISLLISITIFSLQYEAQYSTRFTQCNNQEFCKQNQKQNHF